MAAVQRLVGPLDLSQRHPVAFTLILCVAAIVAAMAMSLGSYVLVGQYNPGPVYQVLCALVIAAILAPAFLGPLIQTMARLADATRSLHQQAITDALTGLPNSRGLFERLPQAIAEADGERPLAVYFIDLDHFKDINDTLGHPVGDTLLKQVAGRITALAENGFVSRFGGDEFVALRPVRDTDDAMAFAQSVIAAISAPFDIDGNELRVQATIGIAMAPAHSRDPSALLRSADLALYKAKAAGRGAGVFFDHSMDVEAQSRRTLGDQLRLAVSGESLSLSYQPLVDKTDLGIRTCEALARWYHKELGPVSPNEFIPMAESIGLIIDIGTWVLEEACRAAAEWPEHIRVAVNISPVHFVDERFLKSVDRAVAEAGIHPSRLEIEITETTLLRDTARTRRIIQGLRDRGVRVALDDFGSGFAGLNYLHQLSLDKVKIDQRYIRDAVGSPRALALLRGVTRLMNDLGITVAVEGVETDEQAAIVATLDVDEVQGYLFGPPIPAGQIGQLLNGRYPQAAAERPAVVARQSKRRSAA